MTATAAAAFHVTTDAWTLRVMREAKAHRDANPDAEHAAADAYLDAYLDACEAAAAEVGETRERPEADAPAAPRGTGSGASSYTSTRNAPTDAQLRFIASLSRELGYELQTPRDRSHASLIIDGAKKAVEKARREGAAAPRPERKATEGQASYLADLLATRQHEEGVVDAAELTFAAASAMIDRLSRAPRTAAPAAHGIREGRYAEETGDAATFYRVSRTGRIYVQAGPAEHPYRGKLNAGLEWIKANQRDAAALYGRLIGSCGRCGRELTDETSRALGLGPICADKGW